MSTPPFYLNYIHVALSCILYLVGFVAGIIALVRKKTLLGILAMAGFFLLGLSPLTTFAVPFIADSISNTTNLDNLTVYYWASFCIQSPLLLIGMGAILAFVFKAIARNPKTEVEENHENPLMS
jgi:hypothetical protein